MKRFLILIIFFFAAVSLFSQDLNKDSIIVRIKSTCKSRSKITITLDNCTGKELQRMNPMAPLNLFKWNGKMWEQITQIGYCSCGMFQCPPPPELIPFYAHDVLAFEWDQMESRCTDMQKGTKELKWAGKGLYKVVFEFKMERNAEGFQVEKTFRIR